MLLLLLVLLLLVRLVLLLLLRLMLLLLLLLILMPPALAVPYVAAPSGVFFSWQPRDRGRPTSLHSITT